jgi:transcription elongation factor GreA
MNKQFHLTNEGVKELQQELKEAQEKRGEIAERIATAREFGDLRENAEYQSAKQEQEKNEDRIAELEHILQNVEIIKKTSSKKVHLGSKVVVKNGKKEKELQVVGTVEADPLEGKISDESPIGQALLGKQPGEKIEVNQNGETVTYKVVEVK